ncbi:MAG: peptidoglycan DD-metalloendopeptidase family protein, partial [Bacteroidota bacterium]
LIVDLPVEEYEYGIRTDTFQVVKGEIRPNQFLSDILLSHHIPYPEIDYMVRQAKPVFDVRRMASGKRYTILCSDDSLNKAQAFIYELSSTDFVVFDWRDSLNIYRGEKEVEVREGMASGVIRSSLYETLIEAHASPALAMEMANIYAWSIDFYRIQKGDRFKVVYEMKYVDDEFVGVGAIKAAVFQHWDTEFYAFQFEQDSVPDYFDEKANSLRKAFLKAPLKYGRLTSGYTMRRFHPVQKRWKAHLGTDYSAPHGTPIMAVGDGKVTEARFGKYNGNYVKIRHNSTYTTQYLHMSRFAKGIRPGKMVRQGDIIGYVGSTGLSTGPHVCFRFWKNGKQVDHRREKLPPSLPVKAEHKERYEQHMQQLKQQLESIPYEHGEPA